MVTGTHPEEVDLFDYVEGELSADRRTELEFHLASCATCAKQVALVQAGKDALRESQLLHLPPARREAISTRETSAATRAGTIRRMSAEDTAWRRKRVMVPPMAGGP